MTAALLALTFPGIAYGSWGPEGCSRSRHCYALAIRSTHTLASIAEDDNETADVYDWEEGGFLDQEQWVSWPGAKYPEDVGWVESGITEGGYVNCCIAYPFAATMTQNEVYHELEASGPVESGSGKYNYTMIYDSEVNGVYHVYWSGETNTPKWFEVARYGGGRPAYIEHEEAGLEAATNVNPYHAGRHQVAVSNGGEWYPWSGAYWEWESAICVAANRESKAEGNIEWDPGHSECKGGKT